jgi:hypothetical protein
MPGIRGVRPFHLRALRVSGPPAPFLQCLKPALELPAMPTVKVKRPDGLHCFNCNATVGETDGRCPKCGLEFVTASVPPPQPDRIKRAFAARRSSSRLSVIIALAAAGLLAVILIPRRNRAPAFDPPAGPRPGFQVIETVNMAARGIGRLSVAALVRPGLTDDSLRLVLDWLIYSTLDSHNRQQKQTVRVVWAYLLEDSAAGKVNWRAMAIWTDPKLPERLRPAGMGGDATEQGSVEYDFTNSVRLPDSTKEGQ